MHALSVAGAVALLAPASLLAIGAWLGDAPGEWARGALGAYVAVAGGFLAGLAVPVLGIWGAWILLLVAFAGLATGGVWGLAVSTVVPLVLAIAAFGLTGAGALSLPACGLSIAAALGLARWFTL